MKNRPNFSPEWVKSYCSKNGFDVPAGLEVKKSATLPKIPKPEAAQLVNMKTLLTRAGIKFESEYKFCETRKWRFDIAIPERKIFMEYEGIFSNKSRHTNVMGYSADTEKYNAAASLGWTGFRYTAITVKNFEIDIMILKTK